MGRLRELLAQGGIAVLALVFALAFAAFHLAVAIAREVVSVPQQHLAGDDGQGFFSFTVLGTEIVYLEVLYHAVVLALLGTALLAVWLTTRSRTRLCPECMSRVPMEATVCRFCTSELTASPHDA